MREAINELPTGLKLLRHFALFVAAVFGLASVFLLLVVFFAPGPVQVNGQPVELDEFRGLGLGVAAGAAVVASLLGLSLVGLSRRERWFRSVLMLLATAVLGGGVVVNLVAGRVDLALASAGLAVPAVGVLWWFLFKNPSVREYLGGHT